MTADLERSAGWRARIGVIVPPSNTTNEIEFNRMKPDGVSVHFTRTALHQNPAADDFRAMLADVAEASADLAACKVDVVAYGCTSGSMACPADRLIGTIRRAAPVPAISTAGAIVDALRALGVRRIGMATPYSEETNAHEKAFLERNGFEVLAMAGLGLNSSLERIQKISRVAPKDVLAHARNIDRPDAEAILICCTDFATIDIIETLERELAKPVVSSNTATFWSALRAGGLAERVSGYGRLLALH